MGATNLELKPANMNMLVTKLFVMVIRDEYTVWKQHGESTGIAWTRVYITVLGRSCKTSSISVSR